eukprot:TRINITY_DN1114_c0_g1::TRINITY_DN1114_c0_g1_i1::g.17210::m.17210 TRINITY_DN1114_c0_g1::TRINITY_DN1114_c0_g1_i1::g.17210  ORF type:complete len:312 (+),score=0.65,sp/O04619/ADNT1_ARATH/37.85/5e-60,Mito_carr/PF00153.22/1.3e-18,Mito_carr/PF00153.22/1.5e-16,Mito_carr/PF00153.22/2.6e-22,BtpA/PF03437.10/0.18 TRINITY_DN1114_c0_g1_i1:38-973(+)
MADSVERIKSNSFLDICKHLLGGAIAGAVAKSTVAPLERVKILIQVRASDTGIAPTLGRILREEGVLALWRSNGAMVARVIPYAAIQYASFEQIRLHLIDENGQLTPMKRAIGGSIAGATSVLATYPLDVLRTRIASQGQQGQYRGIIHGMSHLLSNRRVAYQGLGPTLLGIIPYAGTNYCMYGTLKQMWRDGAFPFDNFGGGSGGEPSIPLKMVIGGISGSVSQTVCYPLDVVRRRMQVEGHNLSTAHAGEFRRTYRTTFQSLHKIARLEGIRGLYKGVHLNFIKTPLAISISFVTYDTMKSVLNSGPPL